MSDEFRAALLREAAIQAAENPSKDVRHFARSVADYLTTPAAQPSAEPVAEVESWTNSSYSRNYKLRWLRDVPAGTKLYATTTVAAPAAPCQHPKTVTQHTGDGTPVEFCPDCGRNVSVDGRPLPAAPVAGEPTPNPCKLTECQGKPRCKTCLAMEPAGQEVSDERHIWATARSAVDSMSRFSHGALSAISWTMGISASRDRLDYARRVEAAVRGQLSTVIAQRLASQPAEGKS